MRCDHPSRRTCCLVTLGLALASLAAAASFAAERYLDFVHGLQERGYGELAVAYLNSIQDRADLPDDVRAVLDLEMALSLRIAAAETRNPALSAERLTEARAHLDKFAEQQPDHPRTGAALSEVGEIAFARGQALLKDASSTPDQSSRASINRQAREALEEAQLRFGQAAAAYQSQFLKLAGEPSAPAAKRPPRRTRVPTKKKQEPASAPRAKSAEVDDLEDRWCEARVQSAMASYYLAQTYADSDDPAGREALRAAAKAFDDIFQDYRLSQRGVFLHLWHGKALAELGESQTALDVFDEVLANAPDPGEQATDANLTPLFAEAQRCRLQVLAGNEDYQALIAEADAWLQQNKSARETEGYQGITFELAKAQLAQSQSRDGDAQRKMAQSALAVLAEMALVNSPYKSQAILLRRQHAPQSGWKPRTLDEALSLGDAAAAQGLWDEAIAGYQRAIELAPTANKPDPATHTRFKLARTQFNAGKLAESLATAETVAREQPPSAQAPAAASLAIAAATRLQTTAKDKAAAEGKLFELGKLVIARWPQRAEADEARIMLAKLHIARRETDSAIQLLQSIAPTSDRRPAALFLAAQIAWREYLVEKQKPRETAAIPAPAIALRKKAMQLLTDTLGAQSNLPPAAAAVPDLALESRLLLAEAHLDADEPRKAADILEPIVNSTNEGQPRSASSAALRATVLLARASIALQDAEGARRLTLRVLEAGEDEDQVNLAILELAKVLHAEWQRTVETAAKSSQGFAQTSDPEAAANKDLLTKVLDQLRARRGVSPAGRLFVADAYLEFGSKEPAREQYRLIVQACQQDPTLLVNHQAALNRARAQLSNLLLADGDFQAALAEVDELLERTPQDFEALMQRGRILQSWARTDPERYPAAVAHWTRLRTLLQRLPKRPLEYYQVVYNVAECLSEQSQRTKDPAQARQAEQVLKAAWILSPELSGPEMVAKYQALLDRCLVAQGRPAEPRKP